jgi:tetraacyldisaccharide 4'-kinase
MRAPGFWQDPPGLAAALLSPAAALYGAVAGRRLARPGARAPVPVICVGNLTAGGAGKTPTVLALVERLAARGERPAVLTRGYGGRLAGPVAVSAQHTAAEVGDEPLLLARAAPTVVARDRPAGARLAAGLGASAIIMDDGLQNPSLSKDLSLAVVDAAVGVGNGHVIPAGPLRAPLRAQWPRVDAVLLIGDGAPGEVFVALAVERGKPVLRARLRPAADGASLAGRRVLAFAGIGRPDKFFATLAELGADVVARRAFADHHPYHPAELAVLRAEAARQGLLLVTTAKDAARLSEADRAGIEVLDVELVFRDDGIDRLLDVALRSKRQP